jgi:hypothetical protein
MAAEIYGGSEFRTMDVRWNGSTVGSPVFQYTGRGPTTMGWFAFSHVVQGTGLDTLEFASTTIDQSNYGPALDNVSVVPVPTPATAVSMLVGGFACLRRRRAVL